MGQTRKNTIFRSSLTPELSVGVPSSDSGYLIITCWLSLNYEITALRADDQVIILNTAVLALESLHRVEGFMAGHAGLLNTETLGFVSFLVAIALGTLGTVDALVNVTSFRRLSGHGLFLHELFNFTIITIHYLLSSTLELSV